MEMKCSTPCDEGSSTLDALATSGNSSRMTLPKEPGGKAINLGRAGGLVSGNGGHSPGGLAALAATRLRGGGWIRDVNL
jgi:hypothetical protein